MPRKKEEKFTEEKFLELIRKQYDALRGNQFDSRRTDKPAFAGITQYQVLCEAIAQIAYKVYAGELMPDREEEDVE